MGWSTKLQVLGKHMKKLESPLTEVTLDPTRILMARLDGCCFSSFTKGLLKPFDIRLHRAMVYTAQDLLMHFQAVTAYTQSDELSLLFPAMPDSDKDPMRKGAALFGGRAFKLVSVLSSYCTARFNYHFAREIFDEDESGAITSRQGLAYFDARVFSVATQTEAAENFYWRQQGDGVRNSVSMLASSCFPPAKLHGLKRAQMLDLLDTEKGIKWADQPLGFRIGTMIKKEEFIVDGIDPRTNEVKKAVRTRPAARHVDIKGSDDPADFANVLFAPTWQAAGPHDWIMTSTV